MSSGPRSHEDDNSRVTKDNSVLRSPAEGDSSSSQQTSPFNPTAPNPSDAPTALQSPFQPDLATRPTAQRSGGRGRAPTFELQLGALVANRYEILHLLGHGGMGAVYKARDLELDRFVALKVIRSDLVDDGNMLQRFKQEILLSSKITDRHVVRIYDLGEGDGFKFISMEYIEGRDLRSILARDPKMSVDEAVRIVRQVFVGLASAHEQNIIHRDLKPANIMRDADGRVLVMDFGLARTVSGDGMTGTGMLVGTMEYMSPEQAQCLPLDARSDIFSVGLILYELLTGKRPYPAESAIASLVKRTRDRAVPVCEHDHSIPEPLSRIVSKCLEPEPKARFQNVREVLNDLDRWQAKALFTIPRLEISQVWSSPAWRWTAIGLLLIVTITGGVLVRGYLHRNSSRTTDVVQPDVSMAILPFRNATSDTSLDWLGSSLAEMLSTDIGQSGHLRTVSPEQVRQILSDLRMTPGSPMDDTALRRIAQFSNADTIIWGQYAHFGDQIRIDVTIHDLKRDRVTPLTIEANGEKGVPFSIDKLAEDIRQNLAVPPDAVKELKASSFQPTSKSMEGLRQYQQGLESLREGKYLEAQKGLEGATAADPQFAMAFSRLAQCYANLGYDDRAEEASRHAILLSESLPAAERYQISAINASITKDYAKAIVAYEDLVKAAPNNPEVQFALAGAYENNGDFAKAEEHYQRVVASNPKDISGLLATGRVAIKSGNVQASLDPLNRALSLTVTEDNQEQRALVLQALGIAYGSLNKPDEALRNYEQSLEIKKRLGQKKGQADSLNMIAQTYDVLGKQQLAISNYTEALRIYRAIGDRQDVGNQLLNLGSAYTDRGRYDEALDVLKESLQIEREIGDKNNEGLCLTNIGSTYAFKGDYDNARTYFEQALQVQQKVNVPSDIADTLHNLGEVAMKTSQYDQALDHYLRALELRRQASDKAGSAKESDSMGILFAYEGRYGAALNAHKEAMNGFRELQDRSYWMAETLGGYGYALAQVGQYTEAGNNLREAFALARDLKNDSLSAQIVVWQADASLYQGNADEARRLYSQAAAMLSKSSKRDLQLEVKLKLAEMSLANSPSRKGVSDVQRLAAQAGSFGLKYTSVDAALFAAKGWIELKDYKPAHEALANLLATSEKLSARPLVARSHHLMGTLLRLEGKTADAAAALSAMSNSSSSLSSSSYDANLSSRYFIRLS